MIFTYTAVGLSIDTLLNGLEMEVGFELSVTRLNTVYFPYIDILSYLNYFHFLEKITVAS